MNRRRRRVLPWLVSAMVVAVFVPTFAWGESRAEPAAGARRSLVGDNYFQDAASGIPATTA